MLLSQGVACKIIIVLVRIYLLRPTLKPKESKTKLMRLNYTCRTLWSFSPKSQWNDLSRLAQDSGSIEPRPRIPLASGLSIQSNKYVFTRQKVYFILKKQIFHWLLSHIVITNQLHVQCINKLTSN